MTAARASIRREVRIRRSADELWEWVGDPTRLAEWWPGITACVVDGDSRTITMGSGLPMPEKLLTIAKINTFHVALFSDFLQRMKDTPDGDGSLLDHSLYLYGSGMGNPSLHDHEDLPIVVAGGAATGLKGGRHIRSEKPTPLANLHVTLLDRVGVHLDSFKDSTGRVEDLFERAL